MEKAPCSLWRAVVARGRCGFIQVPPLCWTLPVTSCLLMGPDMNPGDGTTVRRFLFTKVILLLETELLEKHNSGSNFSALFVSKQGWDIQGVAFLVRKIGPLNWAFLSQLLYNWAVLTRDLKNFSPLQDVYLCPFWTSYLFMYQQQIYGTTKGQFSSVGARYMNILVVCSDGSNQSLQVLLWDWTPTLCRCFYNSGELLQSAVCCPAAHSRDVILSLRIP